MELSKDKAEWLATFLALPNGIPALYTAKTTGREVIAIDGKTVCASFDRSCDQDVPHIVSA